MDVSSLLIPLLLTAASLWALGRRLDVYDALTAGAAEGLTVLLRIVPSLIALLTAVYMLRASGALALLARVLAPVLEDGVLHFGPLGLGKAAVGQNDLRQLGAGLVVGDIPGVLQMPPDVVEQGGGVDQFFVHAQPPL